MNRLKSTLLALAACSTAITVACNRDSVGNSRAADAAKSEVVTASQEFDSLLQVKYESLQQYECTAVPHAIFGDPIARAKESPRYLALKNDFIAAEYGNSADGQVFEKYQSELDYWIWRNGDNVYYCLAFNSNGELVSKNIGRRVGASEPTQ